MHEWRTTSHFNVSCCSMTWCAKGTQNFNKIRSWLSYQRAITCISRDPLQNLLTNSPRWNSPWISSRARSSSGAASITIFIIRHKSTSSEMEESHSLPPFETWDNSKVEYRKRLFGELLMVVDAFEKLLFSRYFTPHKRQILGTKSTQRSPGTISIYLLNTPGTLFLSNEKHLQHWSTMNSLASDT